jgi:hypothetical protein
MFVFYIEGPRDKDVLRAWARRLNRSLGRALSECSIILGGRQPQRAAAHFRDVRRVHDGARALCVLDRDGGREDPPQGDPALEFHVWERRHIESYLLVPDAIRRSLRLPHDDRRLLRACRDLLPEADDKEGWGRLDAKRLLAPEGELTRVVGRPIQPGRIARAMREDEIHEEVRALLAHAQAGFQGGRGPCILGGHDTP